MNWYMLRLWEWINIKISKHHCHNYYCATPPTGCWKRYIDRITEWTLAITVLSSNLKAVYLITGDSWISYHTWVKTTDLLIALHISMKAIDPSCHTSWQGGVLYDVYVVKDVISILKAAGKRVRPRRCWLWRPRCGDVDGPTLGSTEGGDLTEPTIIKKIGSTNSYA